MIHVHVFYMCMHACTYMYMYVHVYYMLTCSLSLYACNNGLLGTRYKVQGNSLVTVYMYMYKGQIWHQIMSERALHNSHTMSCGHTRYGIASACTVMMYTLLSSL